MSRFIPPHPKKGSPEAKAWGAKMRALRTRRGPSRRRTAKQANPIRTHQLTNSEADALYKYATSIKNKGKQRYAYALYEYILAGQRGLGPDWKRYGIQIMTEQAVRMRFAALVPALFKYDESNPKSFHNIEKSGFHRGQYVGYGGGTWKIHKYGTGSRTWIAVKQGGGGEFYASDFADLSAKLDALAKKNPGVAYHRREAEHAHKVVRETADPDEKIFYAGVESAHRISESSAKRLGMNRPRTRRIPPPKRRHARRNPLAVFGVGNPERKRVNCGIAGVVYSRCMEIRAEKTHYKPGLYRHPFSRKSGVQILALDNGDLLVHSTRGVNLWKPV